MALAKTHHQSRRLADAEQLYRRALAADPDEAEALHFLGILCHQTGRGEEALGLIVRSIGQSPVNPKFLSNLGSVLQSLGRIPAASLCYRNALACDPGHVDALYNLGNALFEQKQAQGAVAAYDRALRLNPRHAWALNNLGNALQDLERLDEAAEAYRRALDLMPEAAAVHASLGDVHRKSKRLDEALDCYREALRRDPGSASAENNLGWVLQAQERSEQAVAAFLRAMDLRPEFPDAYYNLGVALFSLGRRDEAAGAYRHALACKPDHADALQNVGVFHFERGDYRDALACFERVLALQPGKLETKALIAQCRQYLCSWDGLDALAGEVLTLVRSGRKGIAPFAILALASDAADQLACAVSFAEDYRVPAGKVFGQWSAPQEGKIRLAYLSADFRDHPVSMLIAELIERHDRERFHVTGYSLGVDSDAPVRQRLKAGFDDFVDLAPLSDDAAAARIHADGIHILVDLMGYTQSARTGIPARRPAPIQVNFLGFPATMGAGFIDYIIADSICIPPGQEGFYSERVVRLPETFQPNDRRRPTPTRLPSRTECGLPDHGLVFCTFNNSYKITPGFFDIWMRLLAAVPGSSLWLRNAAEGMMTVLRREAARRAVDPARLIFAPKVTYEAHFERLQQADLFLDSLPYNAHTTASDALWAGVPVLTCLGRTYAGRVAASVLHAVGLGDLVAETPAAYEAMALSLAKNPERLLEIRRRLRENRDGAPLFDTPRYARHMDEGFRLMWENWRAGHRPRAIDVPPL